MLSNQSIKAQKLDLSIAKSIATSIRVRSITTTCTSLIVFLSESTRQQLNESTFSYLSARQLLQLLHEHFFITVRDIWRKHTRLHVKSTRSLRFCSRDFSIRFEFRFVIMKVFIFAISTDRTTSISLSLKSLFTYEERLASLLITRHYFDATRRFYFKVVMIVADFSKRNNSVDSNDIECLICFLRLYSEYYTFESLKKHLRNASHCSFVQQLQQKVESKIVEKSKIEFSFASLVKSLSTYENRLTSLDKWRNVDSKNVLVVVEFSDIDIWYKTQCAHCSIEIFDVDDEEKSLKYHLRKSSQCSLALQLEKKTSEVIIEIAKLISVAADIDFFDAIFLCDIQKFNLFCETANFVQQLRRRQHQYRESNLLTLLFDCFRDFALIWYKQQCESEIVKSLSEWLKVLIIAFFAKSSKFETFTSSVSSASFSSQYHSCLNCFAFFSFLIRLLQHNQSICKKVVCKHCERTFESNNKFHEHVRQHHTKSMKNRVVKVASKRSFNKEKNKISSISSTISTTTSTISSKQQQNSRYLDLSHSQNDREIHLFRSSLLQQLHQQHHRSARILRSLRIKSYQRVWRLHQSSSRLHQSIVFQLRSQHFHQDFENFRSFILQLMIRFACFVRSQNHLIYVSIKSVALLRKNLTLVHLSSINHESSFTFRLQSIRRHRLLRVWKTQNRRVFNNIRLRNRFRFIVLLCQKNRSFHHTKSQTFFTSRCT